MSSQSTQSPWKKYKRYSDNIKVEARLVTIVNVTTQPEGIMKLMEVRESKGDEIKCPSCGHVLSQTGGKQVPNFQLDPQIFHERYKPIDVT